MASLPFLRVRGDTSFDMYKTLRIIQGHKIILNKRITLKEEVVWEIITNLLDIHISYNFHSIYSLKYWVNVNIVSNVGSFKSLKEYLFIKWGDIFIKQCAKNLSIHFQPQDSYHTWRWWDVIAYRHWRFFYDIKI